MGCSIQNGAVGVTRKFYLLAGNKGEGFIAEGCLPGGRLSCCLYKLIGQLHMDFTRLHSLGGVPVKLILGTAGCTVLGTL